MKNNVQLHGKNARKQIRIHTFTIICTLIISGLILSGCGRINEILNMKSDIYFQMRSEDGWGIMDCSGKWVVEPISTKEFIIAGPMVNGLAPVRIIDNPTYMTYIDKKGNMPFKEKYDNARPFSEGLAAVMVDEKWGFIDTSGEMVIEPQFLSQEIGNFQNGLANVVTKLKEDFPIPDEWIFIDKEGEKILGPYMWAGSFSDGYAEVRGIEREDEWTSGFINSKGDYVLQFSREDRLSPGGDYSEGLFPVTDLDQQFNEGKCSIGFMNKNKEWIIEPEFCSVGVFKDGLATASTTQGPIGRTPFGYIDTKGEMVIEEDYLYTTDFSDGCAAVFWDDYKRFGLIDPEGNFIYRYEQD